MAEPVLRADGVVKRYGGLTAVAGLTLAVAPGEVLGIIGPNGAGKSTTFDLISGFRRPDAGSVHLGGVRIDGLPAHRIARMGLARSFQRVQDSRELTVEDVLVTAALIAGDMRAARHATDAMLERLDLGPMRGQQLAALSLPDRKMVEFGRCLVGRPRIVLLDEIMAGLTLAEAARPMQIVRECCAEGIAFVVVEHLMAIIVALCDRVVAMDFGQQVTTGTPAAVLADPHVRATYLGVEEGLGDALVAGEGADA